MNNKKKGFTLIELLIVISIIAVLASITLFFINDSRAKARDSKRVSDIQQINKAISLYHLDNGKYPDLGTPACADINSYSSSCFASSGQGLANWNTLASQLSPYLPILPSDPCPTCTALSIFNTAFAANNFEYVYHAPAFVRDYLNVNSIPVTLSELQSNAYSIYANNLEKKSGPHGTGLSLPQPSDNTNSGGGIVTAGGDDENPTDPSCPYQHKELCNLLNECNQGKYDACFKLAEDENNCPYVKEENAKDLCSWWFACYKDFDAKSCDLLNKK